MKALFKIIDKLIANPTPVNLMALNKVFSVGIAFNAPHGFKIKTLTDDLVTITLPNRKLNTNHLGGIHACAMATVGEYCAGVSLLRHFGIGQYRFILSDLYVVYTYQGRTDLEGTCSPRQINKEEVTKALESDGKHGVKLETVIRDINGKEVATVTTNWQLKVWEQVKTK